MVSAGGNFTIKAKELQAKADATMKGSFFGNMFGSKGDRKNDAKDLYQ